MEVGPDQSGPKVVLDPPSKNHDAMEGRGPHPILSLSAKQTDGPGILTDEHHRTEFSGHRSTYLIRTLPAWLRMK